LVIQKILAAFHPRVASGLGLSCGTNRLLHLVHHKPTNVAVSLSVAAEPDRFFLSQRLTLQGLSLRKQDRFWSKFLWNC
jgi:hypothetical protein